MNLQKLLGILCIASLGALAGCTHGARLETPTGFANLGDDGAFSYRATSARGVVVTARTEPNDVAANTAFWAESIDMRLKEKGYVADGQKDVRTNRGLDGVELRYTTSRHDRLQRYWVAVFATKSHVFVIEAAGDKEYFDPATATVDQTIATLDATN